MHVNKNSFWDNLSQNKTEAITMNEEKREFIKSSKTGKFTIGLFRTTRPITGYDSLEEIISEDAVIKHDDNRFARVRSTQEIRCQHKELWDLKKVIEEIEYNTLPDRTTKAGHLSTRLKKMPLKAEASEETKNG
jgi:hypothetical protein